MILDLDRFLESARPVWRDLEQAIEAAEQDPDPESTVAETERFFRL